MKANKVEHISWPVDREFIVLWYYEEDGEMYLDGVELYYHLGDMLEEPVFMNLNSSNQNHYPDGKDMFTHWIEVPDI